MKIHPVAAELFHRTDGRYNADGHRKKNFSNIYLLQFLCFFVFKQTKIALLEAADLIHRTLLVDVSFLATAIKIASVMHGRKIMSCLSINKRDNSHVSLIC